jgi:uncharacterized 2Fe-2S/4Fe-4S cluster protein (DUF4445 family)
MQHQGELSPVEQAHKNGTRIISDLDSVTDYIIEFEPIGWKGKCHDSESILACARRSGLGISSVCGGRGTCHTCRVRLLMGILSEPTRSEIEALSPQELAEGWRLACQATPASNCKLVLLPESMSTSQRVYLEGLEVIVPAEPPVKAYHLQLTAPSLSDQKADANRLLEVLNEQYQRPLRKIDTRVLRSLSTQIRAWNWECQASVRDDEVVALGPWPSGQLGLAVDLGTTTIAGYLLDLNSGKTLASQGIINPQISYGEDIISRINYVIKSPHEGIRLQKLVIDKLNEMASYLCSQASTNTNAIVEAVVVSNTAMHHLLLGLPVRQLVLTPFTAAASLAIDIKAYELGINIAPGAYIHFPPIIGGFVGSDHVAMLLSIDSRQVDSLVIALDIGTNTEISLINGVEISTASCASGPAFEGGHIKHGMRAAKGAIEKLQITKDTVQYQTIGEAPPVGLCGSGALDALAQLYLAGVVDNSGRLRRDHPRVRMKDNQAEFLLVDQEEQDGHPAIVITQKDIRELQLANAAIRTGIHLLLETNGFTEEQIRQVIIAGAFGSYINLSSAVTVGLLPPLPLNNFRQVGNAAGMGAKLVLVSLSRRKEAQAITSRTRYIELASNSDFKQTFIETSHFGRYWIKRGKREELD